ncbi:phage tail tube protein [Tenacibaculum sp. nBUS_03]|uniref:phage tail tube protein n=1 Tax=Tenacibaculum sp. nBUS_03 TaxID=3395320 RepID=UPI003EBD8205
MAFYEGSVMRIEIGGKKILHEQDATLNVSSDFKEIASKDTNGVETSPGKKSWSLSSNAYAANSPTTNNGIKDISEAWQSQALVDIKFTDGVGGNMVYQGQAYIESFSIKATTDEAVTFDYSLKGNGELTIALNS